MRIARAYGVFLSGCMVYVVMAACSGSDGGKLASSTSSGSSGHGAGGMAAGSGGNGTGAVGTGGSSVSTAGGEASGGSDGSGIFDALTDPVPEADAEPMSGTRLKARFFLGDDGSKEYQHTFSRPDIASGSPSFNNEYLAPRALWFDSMRNENCAFSLAADGKRRCLPTDVVRWDGFYADAACQVPYVTVGTPPVQCNFTPPKYAYFVDYFDACTFTNPFTARVYPLGAPVFIPPNSTVYRIANNICTVVGSVQGGAAYKLLPEVAPTEFVGATDGIDP